MELIYIPSSAICFGKEEYSKQELFVNDTESVSDGYHTFGQLYHQRAILFAALVKLNKDISWKYL